ncbi:ArpU family phage packaging/lysis transcriptional regulator [Priestia megaterium]
MQLAFFDTNVPKKAKRQAERYMSNYRNIEALVESKRMDLDAKMTTNYAPSESQRGNQFHSETERIAILKQEIEEYTIIKRKLDLIYRSIKPKQREIWERRYITGQFDSRVYNDIDIPDRTYYRLKREMIAIVVDALGLIENEIKKVAE